MKNKKIVAIALTTFTCANVLLTQPVFATSQNSITFEQNKIISKEENDWYAENKREIVEIDGAIYTYSYNYENEKKTITITNDLNDNVDRIVYDDISSNIYLNDELIATKDVTDENKNQTQSSLQRSWQTLGTPSNINISWRAGTTAAVLAGIIAGCIPGVGASVVIARIGIGTLGIIAGQAVGGSVYYSIEMYKTTFTAPMYRSVWGFRAPTGTYYGNYISPW